MEFAALRHYIYNKYARARGHVYQNAKSVPNGSAALPHSLFVSVSAILTEEGICSKCKAMYRTLLGVSTEFVLIEKQLLLYNNLFSTQRKRGKADVRALKGQPAPSPGQSEASPWVLEAIEC